MLSDVLNFPQSDTICCCHSRLCLWRDRYWWYCVVPWVRLIQWYSPILCLPTSIIDHNSPFDYIFVCNFKKQFSKVSFFFISLHTESMPIPGFPKPPAGPCIEDSLKICDFHEDCPAGEDEAQCGEYHLYKHVYDTNKIQICILITHWGSMLMLCT